MAIRQPDFKAGPEANEPSMSLIDAIRLSTKTAGGIAGLGLPPRAPILGDWFKEGDTGFVFAPRGLGKTWLSMGLACARGRKRTARTIGSRSVIGFLPCGGTRWQSSLSTTRGGTGKCGAPANGKTMFFGCFDWIQRKTKKRGAAGEGQLSFHGSPKTATRAGNSHRSIGRLKPGLMGLSG